MQKKYFAIFDEEVRCLKVAYMVEKTVVPETIIGMCEYRTTMPEKKKTVAKIADFEPMLKKIPLEHDEHLHLWRFPWCIHLADLDVWIPILDSDKREKIPGTFAYKTQYEVHNPWYDEYKSLRRKMLKSIQEQQSRTVRSNTPPVEDPPRLPAATAFVATKPPKHVAEIIKRDAIANKITCSISLDDIRADMTVTVTPCFHIFESTSLKGWIQRTPSCPVCLKPVSEETCISL
jgi:hypothetical protein